MDERCSGTHTSVNAALAVYSHTIEGLHAKWRPHPGQIAIGRALLFEGCKDIFIQAGRSFGKTELMAYLLWRWAMIYPGSECYYFAPFMKQAKEILWASRRVQTFGPSEWVTGFNNTEMRISFANGSFIKLDGSDNEESYRGIKPRGLVVFDEFKDYRPEFYENFDPNRAAHNAPLIIVGTPPDRECQYTQVAADFMKDPAKKFFWAPTKTNPHLSKDWLDKKRAELYGRGEGEVWEREYEARFVKGGASKIFPMVNRSFVKPHLEVVQLIARDRNKLEWFLIADPAAISCFGVLVAALNRYTKTWYLLDEIYERDQSKMSVDQIGRRIIALEDEHSPDAEFYEVYDEAEGWFRSEMSDRFGKNFIPTQKSLNDKESQLSLIKDVFLQGKVVLSDRCKFLFWELDNYFKDRHGKIPKKDDHLIDCFRYLLAAAAYELNEVGEVKDVDRDNFRGAKISDDFPELNDMGEMSNDEFAVIDLDDF